MAHSPAWLALPFLACFGCASASVDQLLETGRLFEACDGALASEDHEQKVARHLRSVVAPRVELEPIPHEHLVVLFGPEVAARFGDRYTLLRVRLEYERQPASARAARPPWRVDRLATERDRWRVVSTSGAYSDLPPEYAEARDLERGPRAASDGAVPRERFNLLGGIADALVGGLTLGGVDLELRKRGEPTQELEDLAHIVEALAAAPPAPGRTEADGGLVRLLERPICTGDATQTCDGFVLLRKTSGAEASEGLVTLSFAYAAQGDAADARCMVRDEVTLVLAEGQDLAGQLRATFGGAARPVGEILR